MEVIMEILQSPRSSTLLTRRATLKETGQDQLSTIHEATRKTEIKIASAISSREDASLISKMNRKKNFLINSVERIMTELHRLIYKNADVKRVERQLVKLNNIESKCRKAVEEIVTQIENDELVGNEIEKWEDVHAQIVQAEDQAELYIGRNTNVSQYKAQSVKLSSLELPKFSAKILEWPAFNDAFYAAVGSNPNLSNVQKLTHLRSCLRGSALRCIQGYAVTNENYPKALRDLNNRFGHREPMRRDRLIFVLFGFIYLLTLKYHRKSAIIYLILKIFKFRIVGLLHTSFTIT